MRSYVLLSVEQAVTSDELYGYMTLAKEWKDGVLSIIMRNMTKVRVSEIKRLFVPGMSRNFNVRP